MATRRRKAVRSARRTTKARGSTPTSTSTSTEQRQVDLAPLTAALEAIAKSFAVIALRLAEARLKPAEGKRPANVGPRAQFLQGLGMEPKDIAAVLWSTEPSVRELLSRAQRNRKG